MPVRRPLHIVTGKGGVGKTTVALALAHRLAGEGARVVVAEVEGRGGLALATSRSVGPEPTRLLNRGNGQVLGVQIDARRALSGYLQRYYHLGFATGLLQLDPLVDFATRIAPGLRDILLIGQVTHLADSHPDIDALVLDAPPSGRIGSFLGAGEGLAELTDGSPIAGQAESVMDDLRDPGCQVHVVTLLDELPVTEAIETVQAVRDLGLVPGALVANRCLAPPEVPAPLPPAPEGITAGQWNAMTAALLAEADLARGQTAWLALLTHRTGLDVRLLPDLDPGTAPSDRPAALADALAAL
ncbi:MAG: ArsA-related P-loop ATPase [Micropruina sp.]|uniref:ArsA-related P-loop ATPase n=1 Tax=Micropruina sp. TaxID=2737536 RepID=UPI0039E60B12